MSNYTLKSNIDALIEEGAEFLDSESDTDFNETKTLNDNEKQIKFLLAIDANVKDTKTISFNDINTFDFEHKAFNEVISHDDKAIHLHFDFDMIPNIDELDKICEWLDSLKSVFGDYSIGGYTKDKDIADQYELKFYDNANHNVSIHVVFYETRILIDDLMEIMTAKMIEDTKTWEYTKYEVPKFVDREIYALNKSRKFRHIMSNKFYYNKDKNAKSGHEFRGNILYDLEPITQIVSARGTEPLITREQWMKVFKHKEQPKVKRTRRQVNLDIEAMKEATKEAAKEAITARPITKYSELSQEQNVSLKGCKIEDLDINERTLIMTDEQIDRVLNLFEPTYESLSTKVNAFLNSPYPQEHITTLISTWYFTIHHDNKETVDTFCGKYYSYEDSNKYFFTMLKRIKDLDLDLYHELKSMAQSRTINEEIRINEETELTFNVMKRKRYVGLHGLYECVNDLKQCFGFNGSRGCFKQLIDGQVIIEELGSDETAAKLQLVKPFSDNRKISLLQIARKYSDYFDYDGYEMFSNDEYIIKRYQGPKYPDVKPEDYNPEILTKFLKHIHDIVANGDDKRYDWYLDWWSKSVCEPSCKMSSPHVYGAQGSGKSIPAETFCELLGQFAAPNVQHPDKVFSRNFNTFSKDYIVVNINEPKQRSGDANVPAAECEWFQIYKSLQQCVVYAGEGKYVNTNGQTKSYAKYHFVSNNYNAVPIEAGERHTLTFPVNNTKCGNEEYFDDLMKDIQPIKQGPYNPTFMSNLLHFLKLRYEERAKSFNSEALIREYTKTDHTDKYGFNDMLEQSYESQNLVVRYLIDNFKEFQEGVFLPDVSIGNYSPEGIGRKLKEYCEKKRLCKNGKRQILTVIKPREQCPFIWSLAEYKQKQRELDEEIIDEQPQAPTDAA